MNSLFKINSTAVTFLQPNNFAQTDKSKGEQKFWERINYRLSHVQIAKMTSFFYSTTDGGYHRLSRRMKM